MKYKSKIKTMTLGAIIWPNKKNTQQTVAAPPFIDRVELFV